MNRPSDLPAPALIFDGRPSLCLLAPSFLVTLSLILAAAFGVSRVPDAFVGTTDLTFRTLALYGFWALTAFLVLRFGFRMLVLRSTRITIDVERIHIQHGLFSIVTMSLELFRVIDVRAIQPLWLRLFDVGSLLIDSSDRVYPRLHLSGLPAPRDLRDRVNRAANSRRTQTGVREVTYGQA